MYTLERLEAALRARWGREEMTVYADYLQSIGDPRGEVIAIDLVNLDTVNETKWRTRRHAALAAWLGEDLAEQLGGHIFQGFVQEASVDEALLASPAGEFVRAARFTSNERAVYERFAERPRPWLAHLAISGDFPQLLIDDALAAKLVTATPRLDQLVLRGKRIVSHFAHPTVRHVRIEGAAIASLGWAGDTIRPTGGTFALEHVRDGASSGARLHLAATPETVAIVRDPAIQKHVTHLRLSGSEPAAAQRAIAALPELKVVELAATDRELRPRIAARFPRLIIDHA